MYEHVVLLLSFVYALALAHVLSSVTDLILARERVRWSGLHLVWMLTSTTILFNNWLATATLRNVEHWTLTDEAFNFFVTVAQYFTCSLLVIKVEPGETVDMAAQHSRNRPAFLAAMALTSLVVMVWNYYDSLRTHGNWVRVDLVDLAAMAPLGVAAFSRSKPMQWLAALTMLALALVFLVLFPPTGR